MIFLSMFLKKEKIHNILKECEKPIERPFLLSEGEIREEVRRLLWEFGVGQLLKEYAGANDSARELTIKIANRLKELRPLKRENDFYVDGSDGKDLFIRVLPVGEFIEKFGVLEGNYNPQTHCISLRMDKINDDGWLSYIYDTMMHELTHALQFKTRAQINKYANDNRKSGQKFCQDIGYLFNPYEIGARIDSADFFFRSFVEACGLDPDELRDIRYEKIADTFKNSLMLDEMKDAISKLESIDPDRENAEMFFDIASRLTQSAKDKGKNLYNAYISSGKLNLQYVFKTKLLILNGMKKLYNDYADRLQKLWERIVTDYNGNDFRSHYINREEI